MATKIKKLFLLLLLSELLFAYAPAFAQSVQPYDYATNAHVSSQIEKYLCSPVGGGTGVLYTCINQIYKFAIVVACVIGVFFIVIAGYIYMSADGNTESVDKAKSIIESTITSLVILFAGWVLLNAINPDLIQFHSVQPPAVTGIELGTAGVPVTPAGTQGGSPSTQARALANQILKDKSSSIKLATAHASQKSDNATARQNIIDTANGNAAARSSYTDGGQKGPGDTVPLNENMLRALAIISNDYRIDVSEISGGVHSANSRHYSGTAFDINKVNGTLLQPGGQYVSVLMDLCRKNGATEVLNETATANHVHCGW